MAESKSYPPLTSREALAVFFPLHQWHTAMWLVQAPSCIELDCSCGTKLQIYEADARKLGWGWDDIKKAVKNVPLKPAPA